MATRARRRHNHRQQQAHADEAMKGLLVQESKGQKIEQRERKDGLELEDVG